MHTIIFKFQYCQTFKCRSRLVFLKLLNHLALQQNQSQVMIWLAMALITSISFPIRKELNPLLNLSTWPNLFPNPTFVYFLRAFLVPISILYRSTQETEITSAIWKNNNNVSNYELLNKNSLKKNLSENVVGTSVNS